MFWTDSGPESGGRCNFNVYFDLKHGWDELVKSALQAGWVLQNPMLGMGWEGFGFGQTASHRWPDHG